MRRVAVELRGRPERAPWGLLVRMLNMGGMENAACFSYPQEIGAAEAGDLVPRATPQRAQVVERVELYVAARDAYLRGLVLDRSGDGRTLPSRPSQKGLELLADHFVEQGLFRFVSFVFDGDEESVGSVRWSAHRRESNRRAEATATRGFSRNASISRSGQVLSLRLETIRTRAHGFTHTARRPFSPRDRFSLRPMRYRASIWADETVEPEA